MNIWEELKEISLNEEYLLEMANILDNNIKLESRIPFSFFISPKSAVRGSHSIRTKIVWNPSKYIPSNDGNLELHGDYNYESYAHKYVPNGKELKLLRSFFKKYKVFASAIWEEKLDLEYFKNYLEGNLKFNELLTKFKSVKEDHFYHINHCKNIEELEHCIRDKKIFNMND